MITDWEPWFAWHPVVIPEEAGNGPMWLRWLERRFYISEPGMAGVASGSGCYRIEYRVKRHSGEPER